MSAVDNTFAMLEACAIQGERCPQSTPHGPLQRGHTTELARLGKIRIEVFRQNWRVVTILVGPNAGRQTAPEPSGASRPYMVVDHRARQLSKKEQKRPGPSAPRHIA